MVISIYPIDASRGIWSFRPQPGTQPVKVRVPAGSYTKATHGLGVDLFVPSEADALQLIRWSANAVMRELGGRFQLVKTKGRERVTG